MRDIIVIGLGAGGAVVAKELAARGLDVLVLEAGAHHRDSERDFTHFEIDQNSAFNGVFRFGPPASHAPVIGPGSAPAQHHRPACRRRRHDAALLR